MYSSSSLQEHSQLKHTQCMHACADSNNIPPKIYTHSRAFSRAAANSIQPRSKLCNCTRLDSYTYAYLPVIWKSTFCRSEHTVRACARPPAVHA